MDLIGKVEGVCTRAAKGFFGFWLLLGGLLLPGTLAHAAGCTPASATLTYNADDYFYFYVNGNLVAGADGTEFDAHPITVPIPLADFAAAGTPNYFAAEVANSVASYVGANWLISVTCSDGSLSYITDTDSAFTMYDDLNGTAPPPTAWVQPSWVDSGNLFSQTPIQATPSSFGWFGPLNNPISGTLIPILSHSASGTQNSLAERLYFREAVVLPEITLTPTPTPYPTVCGATPAFVQSTILSNAGCAGSGNPTSFSYTLPAGPGQVLLAQVESTGPVLSGVTWDGVALTALPGSPVAMSNGNLYTYYMVNPPAGTFTLAFAVTNGCSWNPVATVYRNIDTASPFGAIKTNSGNALTFTDTLTCTGAYSIIHDFLAYPNGAYTFTGLTGTQLFASSGSACCNDVYGSYYNASAPVAYSLNYTQSSSPDNWWAETIELKAVSSCGTDTFTVTPTPTPSFTATLTPSVTPSSTDTPTPTPSVTPSDTPSATPTRTATPTATATWTVGNTATDTSTATPTSTWTPTATQTITWTATSTRTDTATATPTATQTITWTATPTRTDTSTTTPTYTATPTITVTRPYSPTDTPTDTPTFTQTVTWTDTSTLTATSTWTPTATQSITWTNTPTWTPTSTVTNTTSPSDTPSATPTWTPTATQTETRTVTPTSTPSATRTATRTNTATVTASPTITVSPTITPTPVPMPYQLVMAAYNSAGELVKQIYSGGAQTIPSSLDGMGSLLVAGSGSVTLQLGGQLAGGGTSLSWNGTNDAGAPVTGGIYVIKVEITDAFGQVTSLIHQVNVLPGDEQQFVRIYNSAGELVRQIQLAAPLPGANAIAVSSSSFALAIDPATGVAKQPLRINVTAAGTVTPEYWNGLNDHGLPVDSGTYTVQLVSVMGGQQTVVASRTIQVIKASDPLTVLSAARVGPNPAGAGQKMWLSYLPGDLQGYTPRVELFDLAGEKVAEASDPTKSGMIEITDGRTLSGGIYIVRFELLNEGALYRARIIKVAVAR